MKNHNIQDQKSFALTQTVVPAQWSKPQLTVTPLRDALSGGNNIIDGGIPGFFTLSS